MWIASDGFSYASYIVTLHREEAKLRRFVCNRYFFLLSENWCHRQSVDVAHKNNESVCKWKLRWFIRNFCGSVTDGNLPQEDVLTLPGHYSLGQEWTLFLVFYWILTGSIFFMDIFAKCSFISVSTGRLVLVLLFFVLFVVSLTWCAGCSKLRSALVAYILVVSGLLSNCFTLVKFII